MYLQTQLETENNFLNSRLESILDLRIFSGIRNSTGAVEWHGRGTGDKVHGKNNSLPDQIIMKLPSNFGRVVLKLLRQPRVTENLRVMLSEGGRPLEWEAPDGEVVHGASFNFLFCFCFLLRQYFF